MKRIEYHPIYDSHEDERRKLSVFFNGEFTAKQIKIIEVKKDSVLGNHYHTYDEAFFLLKGWAAYNLYDIEKKKYKTIIMMPGDTLFIKKGIAHKAALQKGTITIEATSETYTEKKTKRWDKWKKI